MTLPSSSSRLLGVIDGVYRCGTPRPRPRREQDGDAEVRLVSDHPLRGGASSGWSSCPPGRLRPGPSPHHVCPDKADLLTNNPTTSHLPRRAASSAREEEAAAEAAAANAGVPGETPSSRGWGGASIGTPRPVTPAPRSSSSSGGRRTRRRAGGLLSSRGRFLILRSGRPQDEEKEEEEKDRIHSLVSMRGPPSQASCGASCRSGGTDRNHSSTVSGENRTHFKFTDNNSGSSAVFTRTLLFTLLCFLSTAAMSSAQPPVVGTDPKCDLPDGTKVHLPGISNSSCIWNCVCQNGIVQCQGQQCSLPEGCHVLLVDKPSYQCCPCKGCLHKGTFHESGHSWTDPRKPCKRYTCQAGVVTAYRAECHVLCKHPVFSQDSCCPQCEGCHLNGVQHQNGDSFPSPKDPCATCTCQNGTVECVRSACPVLNCPEKYVTASPGSCCPQCTNSRSVYDIRRKCYFRHRTYHDRMTFNPDPCTQCACQNGTVVCSRQVCPPLHCHINEVISDPLTCCRTCRRKRKHCKLKGKSYKHASTWWPDECTSCACADGMVRCHVQQCPNHVECPKGQRLSHVAGKCCALCVESDAVCAVFGDPHYRTFDGRIYNFQGTCRYVLAQDCHGGNFSVRVRNDARLTNDFAWTKSVSVVLRKNMRISLLQNFRVKVNGKTKSLPFEEPSVYAVVRGGHAVTLKTTFGLKVIWDGDSYLEVSVPAGMRNRMCGLCGNYNGIQNDDFFGRDGTMYLDANEFAETWRLGRRRPCGVRKNAVRGRLRHQVSLCQRSSKRRHRAAQECSFLRGAAFRDCRPKVDVEPYYRSCVVDVCDCPRHRKCSCEAITAYVRECQRKGIEVNSRTPNVCGMPSCPQGATFNVCASACPRTCSNWQEPYFCDKPCTAACQCSHGWVLKGKRCVRPDACRPAGARRRGGLTSSKLKGLLGQL